MKKRGGQRPEYGKAIEDMVQDVVDEKKDDWLSEGRLAGVAEGRLQLLTIFQEKLLQLLWI